MPSPIDILPSELFLLVVSCLRHHDLATLMRVSRQFNRIIEPVLWNRIELHRQYFHEDYALHPFREAEKALDRPYHAPPLPLEPHYGVRTDYNDMYHKQHVEKNSHVKAALFLKQFAKGCTKDGNRTKRLAGLIRSLCLPVNGVNTYYRYNGSDMENVTDSWNPFALFTNLDYLEISALWRRPNPHYHALIEQPPFDKVAHTMPNLRTLKLRGYVPLEFAQYALRSAPTITELQLAILDKPVGSTNYTIRLNPPPSLPSDYDDLGENEVEEKYPDYEDLRRETIAPRSLACLTPENISQLTSLTWLHLCRPADAYSEEDDDDWFDLYFSVKSDQRILDEWASLLRGTRSTIEHLILEQRPVGDENEPDGTNNATFMKMSCNGPGYRRFLEKVLPVLLQTDWPALRTIHLVGFEYGTFAADWNSRDDHSVHIDKQLADRFPNVKVTNLTGRRILVESETGEILSGGDVLDTINSFTDDEKE